MPDRDYESCREQRNSEHERRRDWRLALVFIGLCALLVAYLASGCGAAQSTVVLGRWQRAMDLYDCAEKVLPPADSNAAKPKPGSSSPAAATTNPTENGSGLVDGGAADSGMPRGIDTADPWREPDGGTQ